MSKSQITVDCVVIMSLDDLFPGHKKPDTDNYLPNGQQYPAPDHSILEDTVLIERKSRNPKDESQFYKKLQTIAAEQGKPFMGLGLISLQSVIRSLPDPELAARKMSEYLMKQTLKRIKEARKKMEEYVKVINKCDQIKILIMSDNSTIKSSAMSDEQYIGRKMGAYASSDDKAGLIDCIIFIKDPRYAIDGELGYWFKVLIRERLSSEQRKVVENLVSALHHRVGHYADYYSAALKFKNDVFRITYV